MGLVLRRQQRLLRTDPAMEPLANQRALRLLARPQGFWPLRQPGEQVRETLMLNAQGLNPRWLAKLPCQGPNWRRFGPCALRTQTIAAEYCAFVRGIPLAPQVARSPNGHASNSPDRG